MRKLIALVSLFFCHLALAETCPSIKDLKTGSMHGFKAYDSDDDTLLSETRIAQFIKNSEQFILAEWQDTQDHKGAIHCYYRDANGSQLETYLMKANLIPDNPKKSWYQVSGSMHCAAGMEACHFLTNSTQQLAKK